MLDYEKLLLDCYWCGKLFIEQPHSLYGEVALCPECDTELIKELKNGPEEIGRSRPKQSRTHISS